MTKLLAQGAESKLYEEKDTVIKHRFKKTYRIDKIDNKLRGFRTRREAKVLQKLEDIKFPSPKIIKTDAKEKIVMQKLKGKLLKDILEKKDYKKISADMGKKIAILHNNHIIHGDLTTSNMIYNKEIYIFDFGLSFFSYKIEDKAVDLHVLKEALESKHHTIWEACYKEILKSYKKHSEEGKDILHRVQAVEKRGRYKNRK